MSQLVSLCNNAYGNRQPVYDCAFKNIRPCRGLHPEICDEHHSMFGFERKVASWHNQLNEKVREIETVYVNEDRFKLAFAVDRDNTPDTRIIKRMASDIVNRKPEYEPHEYELVDRIACLMGISLSPPSMQCYKGNFDDNVLLIVREDSTNMSYWNYPLKPFYKILFSCCKPSHTVTEIPGNPESIQSRIANLSLTRNHATGELEFVIPNEASTLKYTEDQGNKHSQVIIDAVKVNIASSSLTQFHQQPTVFNPCQVFNHFTSRNQSTSRNV